MQQECSQCKQFKPMRKFTSDPSDRLNDGFARICVDCIAAITLRPKPNKKSPAKKAPLKRPARKRKPKPRGLQWMKLCGVSQDQGFWLLREQKYRCAICDKHFPKRPWNEIQKKSDIPYLDHKHGTTQARGFLCLSCNTSLGHFQDSPKLLRRAADYLERKPVEFPRWLT